MSQRVKIRYFLSKIVKICGMSKKMAASALRADSTLSPTLLESKIKVEVAHVIAHIVPVRRQTAIVPETKSKCECGVFPL